MKTWQNKLSPEKLAELADLEKRIKEGFSTVEAQEQEIGKLNRDSVFRAKAIGELLKRAKVLLGRTRYGQWRKDRFKGSKRSASNYLRIATPEVWEKVEKRLKSEGGCTLREALAIAASKPKETTQKERWRKKLAARILKVFKSFSEEALSHLADDPFFIKRVEELAKERSNAHEKAMKDQIAA